MQKRISITISCDVLEVVDENRGREMSRSAVIENLLREYFEKRGAINKRDLELINVNADYLNREMEDVLRYQAPIDLSGEEE